MTKPVVLQDLTEACMGRNDLCTWMQVAGIQMLAMLLRMHLKVRRWNHGMLRRLLGKRERYEVSTHVREYLCVHCLLYSQSTPVSGACTCSEREYGEFIDGDHCP